MTARSRSASDLERRVEALVSLSEEAYGDALDRLDVALGTLRRGIRQRFTAAERFEPPRSALDWAAIWQQFRRELATFGMPARGHTVDEFGLDASALARIRWVLDALYDRYFRVELGGSDRLPASGPCLLVANHSGILPWDGLLLAHAVERHHASGERPRFLVDTALWSLPFMQPFFASIGGLRACLDDARRLLASGHSVIAFPEGARSAIKPFAERYRVRRLGRGGVLRLALELGVPLVPVGIAGAEEAHPVFGRLEWPARALGLPALPLTTTFPWLGPLGLVPLPSKWVIRIGEPLALPRAGSAALRDELYVARVNEELRLELEELADRARRQRKSSFG
jgi:1-acyl-sn-glycerol-3-phosphate acyltransferase